MNESQRQFNFPILEIHVEMPEWSNEWTAKAKMHQNSMQLVTLNFWKLSVKNFAKVCNSFNWKAFYFHMLMLMLMLCLPFWKCHSSSTLNVHLEWNWLTTAFHDCCCCCGCHCFLWVALLLSLLLLLFWFDLTWHDMSNDDLHCSWKNAQTKSEQWDNAIQQDWWKLKCDCQNNECQAHQPTHVKSGFAIAICFWNVSLSAI